MTSPNSTSITHRTVCNHDKTQSLQRAMSNFEEIIDNIENLLLVDPTEVSLLIGLTTEAGNVIE